MSYSLTVALLSRALVANCSQSLFHMSDFEQKSKERKSEFPTLVIGQWSTSHTLPHNDHGIIVRDAAGSNPKVKIRLQLTLASAISADYIIFCINRLWEV